MSKYRNDNIRNESCELYGAEGVTIFFFFFTYSQYQRHARCQWTAAIMDGKRIYFWDEKKRVKKAKKCITICVHVSSRCEWRKSRYFVCMFKVSWKKKEKNSVFRIYMVKKKKEFLYIKYIEITLDTSLLI